MTHLSMEICRRLREARREKGLSQSVLAAELGCKQSALSMFECGQATKLSDEIVKKLAARLGVSLEKEKAAQAEIVGTAAAAFGASALVRGFCPNGHCPSNVPYLVEDRLLLRPSRALASPTGDMRCALCGEILELKCPSCGEPLNDGACCGACGNPYVAFALPEGVDKSAWVTLRQSEIAKLRSLF